jgi:hypothetical protein
MASKENVRTELLEEFAGIAAVEGDFLDACATIGALLSGGLERGPIDKALGALEKLMFEVIDERLKPDLKQQLEIGLRQGAMGSAAKGGAFNHKGDSTRQDIAKQVKTQTTSGEDPFSKVLVTALNQFEKNLNYPVNKDQYFHPRYVGFVKPKTFLDNIAQGAHWKDVGASPDHGEFTHRIQWFVIAASGVLPAHKVSAIYREVGQCALSSPKKDRFKQGALWARLCDRPMNLQNLGEGQIGVSESNDDYRCPEHFNAYLRSAQQTYPLLSSFLKARHEKRSMVVDSNNFPSQPIMKDYCAKKKYKVQKYNDLNELDRKDIDQIVKSAVLV